MTRFIRLYDSPSKDTPGSIIGFSRTITDGARDPFLKTWLGLRGYTVTLESDEQQNDGQRLPSMEGDVAKLALEGLGISDIDPNHLNPTWVLRSREYTTKTGIPIPPHTVSSGHLLVEHALREQDLVPLGVCLSSLSSIYDGNLRRHVFIDNRGSQDAITPEDTSNIIFEWS